jgi:hypothetical protein
MNQPEYRRGRVLAIASVSVGLAVGWSGGALASTGAPAPNKLG